MLKIKGFLRRSALLIGHRLASIVFTVLLAVSGLQAQPTAESQHSSEGFSVLVDVVVTEADNRLIRNLGRKDFRIYEDGVLQSIDSIQFIEGGAILPVEGGETKDAASLSGGSTSEVAARVDEKKEVCLAVLLDLSSMDVSAKNLLSRSLGNFIQKGLSTDTCVGVFTLNPGFTLLQPFTKDKSELSAAIQNLNTASFSTAQALLSQYRVPGANFLKGITDDPSGYQLSRVLDSIELVPGSLPPRQAPDPLIFRIIRSFLIMKSSTERRHANELLRAVQAIARGMGPLPGRKTLLLVSEGFTAGSGTDRRLFSTIEVANASGLAIYAVQPQGLETHGTSSSTAQRGELASLNASTAPFRKEALAGESIFDRAKVTGSDVSESTLQYLASATGGFTIRNTNDLQSGFEKIFKEAGSYYLLAYRPKNSEYDGRRRTLEVEVDVPDTKVYHRQSYKAVPPGMELLNRDQFQLLKDREQGKLDLSLGASVELRLFPSHSLNQKVLVNFEIPQDQLNYTASSSPTAVSEVYTANVGVFFILRNRSTDTIEQISDFPLKIHLTTEERAELSRLSFSDEVALWPGEYTFSILIADDFSGKAYWFEKPLEAGFPRRPVAISDIVLGREIRKANEPTLLTVDEATIVPSIDHTFSPREKLISYVQICPRTVRDLEVSFSIEVPGVVDTRQTFAEYAVSRARTIEQGCERRARFLELENLKPGTYFLVVSITDKSTDEVFERKTWFKIRSVDSEARSLKRGNSLKLAHRLHRFFFYGAHENSRKKSG